jgi:hypothetical protein
MLEIYNITDLDPLDRAIHEKIGLIFAQLLKIYYSRRSFIILLAKARHWILYWSRWIKTPISYFRKTHFKQCLPVHTHVYCVFPTLHVSRRQSCIYLSSFPCVMYVPLISFFSILPSNNIRPSIPQKIWWYCSHSEANYTINTFIFPMFSKDCLFPGPSFHWWSRQITCWHSLHVIIQFLMAINKFCASTTFIKLLSNVFISDKVSCSCCN